MAVTLVSKSFLLQRLLSGRCALCSRDITASLHSQTNGSTHPIHDKKVHVSPTISTSWRQFHAESSKTKHKSRYVDEKTTQKALVLSKKLFENTPPDALDKENFKSVINTFQSFSVRNRGYIQFMEIALKNMDRFGVQKDVEAYNMILDLVPKGMYMPTNFFQSIMNHAPEQQLMGVKVIQKMEDNMVMPNRKTREIIREAFGDTSHPMKKYQGLMYWFPKMWHINPFPLPEELPKEHIKLCELGLKRIAEYEARLSISYLKGSYPDSVDPEFIATMQSPEQQEMLAEQPVDKALYVEGAFTLWLRNVQMTYFILRGDPFTMDIEEESMETSDNDRDFIKNYNLSLQDYAIKRQGNSTALHNASNPIQEGPIFATCMTSTLTEGTLRQWITTLQEENPHLANIPVVFNLFNLDTGKHHMSELIGDQKLIASEESLQQNDQLK